MKATREQKIKELWHRGRLRYKLHDGQKSVDDRLRNSPHQLFVANIARQWGKSYWSVIKAIEAALIKPQSRIKYGTAFQTDLLEFIIPTFNEVLKDAPRSMSPRYHTQGSKWVFKNGSEIKLIGLDKNPNSIRGNVLDLIVIDEAGFVTKLDYIYHSVIIPATTHRPDCKIIMVSTPPTSPSHAFRDFIKRAQLEGGYAQANIYTNPRIEVDTIERLKKESGGDTSTTWRREYLCEMVTDSNLAIIPDWKDEFIEDRQRDQYWQFYHKYCAMDLGVKHQTALLYGYYDYIRAQLVIESEFVMSGVTMTTEKLATQIRDFETRVFGEHKPHLRISDSNNPLLLQDLSLDHGIYFSATSKGTLEAMVNAVKIMVDRGQIIVHPSCLQLIGCLKYGIWTNTRDKFAEDKVYGHFDALAALIYLVRNLDKITNPIPQTFGANLTDSIVFAKEQNQHKTLRNAFNFKKG